MPNTSRASKIKYYFLATLAVCSIAIVAYGLLYQIPMKKCEAAGNWWSWRYRECAVPLNIVDITRRPIEPAAPASAQP